MDGDLRERKKNKPAASEIARNKKTNFSLIIGLEVTQYKNTTEFSKNYKIHYISTTGSAKKKKMRRNIKICTFTSN